MPVAESFLCGLAIFFYIDIIRSCFQYRRERQYDYNETVPFLIQSVVQSSTQQRFDIQAVAPISNDSIKEEDLCPICFDNLSTIRYRRKTICGHTFCSECLQEWFHKKKSCPVCIKSLGID
uniref:RING-type domain-containing protein n=1 Tax=viral metagenome TaxID=1070528 RepID=A0A6C0CSL8_9ZZZZ